MKNFKKNFFLDSVFERSDHRLYCQYKGKLQLEKYLQVHAETTTNIFICNIQYFNKNIFKRVTHDYNTKFKGTKEHIGEGWYLSFAFERVSEHEQ